MHKPGVLSSVYIPRTVLEEMVDHARKEFPLESCGLLAGHGPRVSQFTRTENVLASRREFSVNPAELASFMRETRENQLEFVGIYHSHPTSPAWPSVRDRQEFHYPNVSYWIVSLGALAVSGDGGVRLGSLARHRKKTAPRSETMRHTATGFRDVVRCFAWHLDHFVVQPFTITTT